MDDRLSKLYEKHKEPEDESELIVIADLYQDCPILHDFCRFTKFNGEPCEPPRLGYGVSNGKLYTTLSDSSRRRSLRVECATFYDGVRAIENHITQGTLDTLWYAWKSNGKSNGKKSKAS
ncbi:unnamed protein product [marine sediment metagenome]|uniref:Uncharacterized protein n=1 Tax=marine sediment metagenome TaxID=412755 RepID=X1CNN6_9ZZZZ